MANKYLSNVPLDKVFWVCDGRILKNLSELVEALRTMSDDTFAYHCNPEKNDFTSWIGTVICDTDLAKELESIRNRETALKMVKHRVDVLKGKVEDIPKKPAKKAAKKPANKTGKKKKVKAGKKKVKKASAKSKKKSKPAKKATKKTKAKKHSKKKKK